MWSRPFRRSTILRLDLDAFRYRVDLGQVVMSVWRREYIPSHASTDFIGCGSVGIRVGLTSTPDSSLFSLVTAPMMQFEHCMLH